MITANEAKALVNSLRAGLLTLSTTLPKIVETRAWEPLGYVSLVELWRAELGDLDLSGAPRAAAVYALLEAGATDGEVVECVKGVGPVSAARYRLGFAGGMSHADAAKLASASSTTEKAAPKRPAHSRPDDSYVQGHYRRPSRPQHRIVLEGFSSDELTKWKKAAATRDLDYRAWLAGLLRDAANGAIDND